MQYLFRNSACVPIERSCRLLLSSHATRVHPSHGARRTTQNRRLHSASAGRILHMLAVRRTLSAEHWLQIARLPMVGAHSDTHTTVEHRAAFPYTGEPVCCISYVMHARSCAQPDASGFPLEKSQPITYCMHYSARSFPRWPADIMRML